MAMIFRLILLVVFLAVNAEAATTVTRYVNTASAGGDGTTNNTSGATAAYATLSAAIADIASDYPNFVTSDVIVDVICEGSAADTTAVVIDGMTTDATRLLKIRATQANRHDGKWNTAKYRLDTSSTVATIWLKDPYLEIDGLQIGNSATGGGYNDGIRAYNGEGSLSLQITNSIIRSTGGATYADCDQTGTGIYFRPDVANSRFTAINNIVYGFQGGQFIINAGGYNNGEINTLYNNTAAGGKCGYGFHAGGSSDTLNFKNNIAQNNSITGYAVGGGSFTTLATADNITEDATSPNTTGCEGGGTCRSRDLSASFENEGAGDFHLKSTDTHAIDLGTDLSGTFTTDIDGQTRSGSWDIGADEYQSGVVVFTHPSKLNTGINLNLNGGIN